MSILVALALIAAGFYDYRTTSLAVARGAREVNPIWRAVQARLGRAWGWGKMAVHGGLAWIVFGSDNPLTLTVGAFLAAIVVGVSYRNTKQAR